MHGNCVGIPCTTILRVSIYSVWSPVYISLHVSDSLKSHLVSSEAQENIETLWVLCLVHTHTHTHTCTHTAAAAIKSLLLNYNWYTVLYFFQVHYLVILCFYTLLHDPHGKSSYLLLPYRVSYYNMIDCIPYPNITSSGFLIHCLFFGPQSRNITSNPNVNELMAYVSF